MNCSHTKLPVGDAITVPIFTQLERRSGSPDFTGHICRCGLVEWRLQQAAEVNTHSTSTAVAQTIYVAEVRSTSAGSNDHRGHWYWSYLKLLTSLFYIHQMGISNVLYVNRVRFFFFTPYKHPWGRHRETTVRFPARTKILLILQRVQIGPGAHPASYSMGTGRPFTRGKAAVAWGL